MRKVFIMTILLSSLLVSCGTSTKKDQIAEQNNEKLKIFLEDEIGDLELKVYFDATNDENNPQIAEQSSYFTGEEVLGQYLIMRLIQGPDIKGSLKSILPRETRLISFSVKDDIAIINLSKEAIVKMSEAKEKACLDSIVSTITQLPSISQINILVENQMVESLGGNFDISKPFGKEDLSGLKRQ